MRKLILLLVLLSPLSLWAADNVKTLDGIAADPAGTNNVNTINGLTWGDASGNATKMNGVECAAAAASHTIEDQFGSDTSANYTAIGGGISISAGNAHGSTGWDMNYVYHETSLSSANQSVQADISYDGSNDSGMVLARVSIGSPKTAYIAFMASGRVKLNTLSNTTQTVVSFYDGLYGTGTYTIKLTTNGTTIKVFVNGTERISVTDNTYSSGDYCGIGFDRDSSNYDSTVDNLIADAL